jgi:hypothetical protein
MHRTLLACCLVNGLLAQAPPTDLLPLMQRCAELTTELQRAIDARDRAAITAAATTLAAVATPLGDPARGEHDVANRAVATLVTAAKDLTRPVGDGSASDRFDLARLRSACTSCHLQRRDRNEERGLFPNRGNIVHGTLRLEQLDGEIRADASGVVVFLERGDPPPPALPRAPVITQRGRRFDPPVLVVTPGTRVVFPNDDLVFHNVFSLSRGNAFDLGTYGKGTEQERVLGTPGLVKVHCNIHPDMAAQVLVLRNSYAAISSPSGFWSIAEVPPGEYTLRVWQGLAEPLQQTVRVAQGEALEVKLKVRETRPRVQHNNKFGRPYKNY